MVAPPLVGMVLVLSLLAFWVLPRSEQARRAAQLPASSKPATAAAAAITPQPAAASSRAAATTTPRGVAAARIIRERSGTVGVLRIGLTLPQAGQRLGEQFVQVQRSTPRSPRFEAVAPHTGIVVEGRAGRIDTISVTNAGAAGRLWKTPDALGIASRMQLVPRTYPSAQEICGTEYWVSHGRFTARWAGGERITSYTLTSRPPPLFAACGGLGQ